MTSTRQISTSTELADSICLWIGRSLEALWLLMALLVPLAFLSQDYVVSEAIISYAEVPKIALLRTLGALMAALWLIEWAVRGKLPFASGIDAEFSRFRPAVWLPNLSSWLKESPARWLVLAAWFFLATTLISTVLSGSVNISVWGEIPGQDGYSAYTVLTYLLAFAVITTHLKTRKQLWRLLGAVVTMGLLVAGYAVFQNYGRDFLNLSEPSGGLVTAFMGNRIFAAAVMSMTVPVSLALAMVNLQGLARSAGPLQANLKQTLIEAVLTVGWSAVLAVQLLGITFTLSRGPWLGTAAALFLIGGLTLFFLGWRTFLRATVVLGLAAAFSMALLQAMGSITILGQGAWFGAIIAILSISGVLAIIANWRNSAKVVLAVGLAGVLAVAVVLGPSWFGGTGSDAGGASGQASGGQDQTASEISQRFSSIQSNVLGGFIGGRGTHWKVSWRLIKDHPWFAFDTLSVPWLRPLIGYGPDLFRYTYLLESPAEGIGLIPLEPDNAHNYFIHQTVEQGFLGLLSSLGLFFSVVIAGAYLLIRRGQSYSSIHKLLLIGLIAVIAGRFLEMMVGVARVSDLTLLWVLLAAFAALPVVMSTPDAVAPTAPSPQPRNPGRRSRRNAGSSSASQSSVRSSDWRLYVRVAIVVWLLGGIGVVTWMKSINYVRASVVEAEGVRDAPTAGLQATLASFDRAIELAPDVPLYHTNRAQVFMIYLTNQNLTPERDCNTQSDLPYNVCLAAQSFQSNLNNVDQNPYYYRSRVDLASSAFNLKLDDQAVKFFEDSSSLVPDSWHIKDELAEAYLEAGQPEDALQTALESLAITENTDLSLRALFLQGVAYNQLGEIEKAARSLEDSLAAGLRGIFAIKAHKTLKALYEKTGQGPKLEEFDKVIQRNPTDPHSYYIRGEVYFDGGLYDEAARDFNKSIGINDGLAEAYVGLGKIKLALGASEDAIPQFDRAIRFQPWLAAAHRLRGLAYANLGQFEIAIENLNEAIRLNPQFADALKDRGDAFAQLGNTELANQDYSAAEWLEPAESSP